AADPGDPSSSTFFAVFPNTGVFRFKVSVSASGVASFNSIDPRNLPGLPDNISTNLLGTATRNPLVPAATLVDRIRLAASPVPLTAGGSDRPVYASVYNFNHNRP